MTLPLQCASLCGGQEVFVWVTCLLDLGTDFLVGNMVFVGDAFLVGNMVFEGDAQYPFFHAYPTNRSPTRYYDLWDRRGKKR